MNSPFIVSTVLLALALGPGMSPGGSPAASGPADKAAQDQWIEPLKVAGLSEWLQPTGTWKRVGKVALAEGKPRELHAEAGDGNLLNGETGGTSNLISRQEFGDIELHVEFLISSRSNSGVYLMGRYELQIYDSFGVEKDAYPGIECGGIYPRWVDGRNVDGHSPAVNASLPPGEWQSFDLIFRAPRFDAAGKKVEDAAFVKVMHNGKLIHENVLLHGPTRSAAFDDEKPTGPLMLQGDHGPVAFRNLRIRRRGRDNQAQRRGTEADGR